MLRRAVSWLAHDTTLVLAEFLPKRIDDILPGVDNQEPSAEIMPSNYQSSLIQEIDDNKRYWQSRNLARVYLERDVISLLRKALTEVTLDVQRLHEVQEDSEDGKAKCVHYTTIGVLMQLLQSESAATTGKIRLYDSMHLNDPDEGNYLPRRISAESRFAWLADQHEFLALDEVDSPVNEIAYLASFVAGDKAADNLVFWRTYGREGRGCSIVCSLESKNVRKVLYGDEVKQAIDLLRPILTAITPIVTANDESVAALLADTVWSSLRSILYLYKSQAYDYERERRCVLPSSEVRSEEICYEYQDKPFEMPRIRHYVERPELSFNDLLPSGSLITIGPCVPQPTHVRRRLSAIANRTLDGQPEIRPSEIPYRLT